MLFVQAQTKLVHKKKNALDMTPNSNEQHDISGKVR